MAGRLMHPGRRVSFARLARWCGGFRPSTLNLPSSEPAMIRAPLFAEPCGDRPGWYIADAEMREVLGVLKPGRGAGIGK